MAKIIWKNPRFINKVLIAILLLGALAVVAGSHLAPSLALPMVLLYGVVGALAVGALVLVAAVVSLNISQWVLRHGGTDTQWFWFSGEPAGLQKLRAQAIAKTKTKTKQDGA